MMTTETRAPNHGIAIATKATCPGCGARRDSLALVGCCLLAGPPCGFCQWCGDDVEGARCFCNPACSQSFEDDMLEAFARGERPLSPCLACVDLRADSEAAEQTDPAAARAVVWGPLGSAAVAVLRAAAAHHDEMLRAAMGTVRELVRRGYAESYGAGRFYLTEAGAREARRLEGGPPPKVRA